MELQHPQSRIVRQLLLDGSKATAPTGLLTQSGGSSGTSSDWPAFYGNLPEKPDSVIAVRDTEGVIVTRVADGETVTYHGVQIVVRARMYNTGSRKAMQLYRYLTESIKHATATIGTTVYLVHGLRATSAITPLGQEPDSSRYVWSLNFTVTLTESEE